MLRGANGINLFCSGKHPWDTQPCKLHASKDKLYARDTVQALSNKEEPQSLPGR